MQTFIFIFIFLRSVQRGTKHSTHVVLADMDTIKSLELAVMRGGTGAGGAPSSRAKPLPEHALHPGDGLGWRRLKGAVRQGADQAAAAAALAPEAWVVQHAEVLQQDTGETTYFVAGEIIDLLCMYSLQVSHAFQLSVRGLSFSILLLLLSVSGDEHVDM